MKVYKRYDKYKFAYPEEMKLILDYLSEHGEILVNESTIESLYYDFSDEVYSAGWMGVTGDMGEQLLEQFEEWLNRYEYEFD